MSVVTIDDLRTIIREELQAALSIHSEPEVDPLLSTADAAKMLGVKPQTMAKWRMDGGVGPSYTRLGSNKIMYRKSTLELYIKKQTSSI